ncbi:MAG: DNA repair protein RecO [Candidatus Yanofskybacteria bacterium]|nr:DNA repair protein RecO [Candidatus Yanofskybacteria bacterium]
MHVRAIVIRKIPVREHDQLVVLYTKEAGRLAATAKGSLRASSAQALALDEGNMIECELVQGRNGLLITGAQVSRAFSGAKSSVARWAAAQFFLQVIQLSVYDEQPDIQLWRHLVDVLEQVDGASADALLSVFRSCQGRMLEVLGYGASGAAQLVSHIGRTPLDDRFEEIAQRRMASLDLLYDALRLAGVSC